MSIIKTGTAKLAQSEVADGVQQVQILRIVIGIFGLILPSMLMLGDWLFIGGSPLVRGSVSAYYYSGMRDILVGSLVTVGVLLITYRLRDRHLENLLSIIGGVSAILAALLPTKRPAGMRIDATGLQSFLGEERVSNVHLGAGIVFITCLILICFLFGFRERRLLQTVLMACTACMILSLIACLILMFASVSYYLFVGEAGAVFFFGIGWLIKGVVTNGVVTVHSERAAEGDRQG